MGRVFFNTRKHVQSLIADYQALDSDSNSVFTLDAAAGLTLTLPAVADAGEGWNCEVIVTTVTTSNAYIITEKTASDGNVITSQFLEAETDTADDGPHSAGHTTVTFQGTPTLGDRCKIVHIGGRYFITGVTQDDGGVVLA
tara:strand:+ start:163 stop:585 length:423 start_codon:yes stop_codon:yes gene_type:complete